MRLLVIGGSDAGIAATLRARELDPSVEATNRPTEANSHSLAPRIAGSKSNRRDTRWKKRRLNSP